MQEQETDEKGTIGTCLLLVAETNPNDGAGGPPSGGTTDATATGAGLSLTTHACHIDVTTCGVRRPILEREHGI